MCSTVGLFSTVGDIMSTVGGVQYRGGYHDKCGGYHEYRGVILSTVGDIQYRGGYHDARGDIMSTVGGYHEYRGECSVPWGESLLLFEYPTVLNTTHGTHDIPPHVSYPPRYSNFKGWYPPTVLNTPHGTHDIPHVHHDIIPPRY